MTNEANPHITVCICTYKRPNLLERLLHELTRQETGQLFSYSIVVADNDAEQSAREVVTEHSRSSSIRTVYCCEREPNIAKARNKALEHAEGDYAAFIDDDEIPETTWLRILFATCNSTGTDGVLGPVIPYFEHVPPRWVVKGGFFERARFNTGYKLHWSQTRTGNVLFRRDILPVSDPPFRLEFAASGEDVDFFKRMMSNGRIFIWCDEAPVYELVPPSRCSCRYLLCRAAIQASDLPKLSTSRTGFMAKSALAVPVYALALPLNAMLGRHFFIRCLQKLSYHAAHILASLGFALKLTRG